jgi:hypothetical protein
MGQKVGLVAVVLVIGWILVTAPDNAASTLRHSADSAGHLMHQLSVFIRDIWP